MQVLGSVVVGCVLAVSACTDDAVVDRDAAVASVVQVGRIFDAVSAMSVPDVLDAFGAMVAADGRVVASADNMDACGPTLPLPPLAMTMDGIACVADACTFDVLYAVYPLQITVNGVIVRDGERLTFTIDSVWGHGPSSSTYESAHGDLTMHGGTLQGGAQVTEGTEWDVTIGYDAVHVGGDGIPTGGSVHARTVFRPIATDSTPSHYSSFDVSGTVAFVVGNTGPTPAPTCP